MIPLFMRGVTLYTAVHPSNLYDFVRINILHYIPFTLLLMEGIVEKEEEIEEEGVTTRLVRRKRRAMLGCELGASVGGVKVLSRFTDIATYDSILLRQQKNYGNFLEEDHTYETHEDFFDNIFIRMGWSESPRVQLFNKRSGTSLIVLTSRNPLETFESPSYRFVTYLRENYNLRSSRYAHTLLMIISSSETVVDEDGQARLRITISP